MKKLISALWLISTLATGAAWAQPYAPNDAGVTNGHWHLNSRDVAANKHILLAMGGVATGPGERVVFPGVLVILNQGPGTPPSTGGTVGTVVNHIGFTVPNVQEAVAKWKAAGVPFEPGAPGRLDQGWVTTTDGLKIEIQEDKLDADGAYRVNDVGVGIAFITDPWGTRIELNERPKAVYLP